MSAPRSPRTGHRTLYVWNHNAVTPAADARHHLRRALGDLNVAPESIDDALVMASELVTNASLYADGPYEIRMRTTMLEAIIEVRDCSLTLPSPVECVTRPLFPPRSEGCGAGSDALLAQLRERGRGLQIVHELSRGCWGMRTQPGCKIIWYAVALPG